MKKLPRMVFLGTVVLVAFLVGGLRSCHSLSGMPTASTVAMLTTSFGSENCSGAVAEEPQRLQLLHHFKPDFDWSTFDWQAYAYYNPDLGNLTATSARDHYNRYGFHEGRIYRKVPTTLRYNAGAGGLCNQLYSHLHVLTLAQRIKADRVIIPPGIYRGTFKNVNRSMWKTAAPDTLLDIEAMSSFWQERGVGIVRGPVYRRNERDMLKTNCLVVVVDGKDMYLETVDVAAATLLNKVRQAATPVIMGNPELLQQLCVHLVLGRSFRALDGSRSLPLITFAAEGFIFAKDILSAADKIVKALPENFFGVHLRVEGDFAQAFGKTPLANYTDTMMRAGFTEDTPVYYASGIFADENSTETAAVLSELKAAHVMGRAFHKEALFAASTWSGFNSEQLALIDLLVLLKAERVVGHCRSSYSWFLLELRALHAISKGTFDMINHRDCLREHQLHHGGFAFTAGDVKY